jgi:hypothetical protein
MGPGIRSQADIVNRMMPREDLSNVTLDKDILPGLHLQLTGRSSDRDKTKAFIHNTLRMRPLVQDWFWQKNAELDTSKVKWVRLCSGKDMKNYSMSTICELMADALSAGEDIVMASISIDQGMTVGTIADKIPQDATLSLAYRKKA